MMPRIIDIVPVHELNRIDGQKMQMFLTHLVEKYPHYAQFARRQRGYKILDNSVIEMKEAFSIERVVEAAASIDADEIILPDVYKDKDKTLQATERALDWLIEHGLLNEFKLMAVPQGACGEGFIKCFYELESFSEVQVLGIPKNLATMELCKGANRIGRPAYEFLWRDRKLDKAIHLLGCWYSFYELNEYKAPEQIRSVDTCLRAICAKYGTYIRPEGLNLDLEEVLGDCKMSWKDADGRQLTGWR